MAERMNEERKKKSIGHWDFNKKNDFVVNNSVQISFLGLVFFSLTANEGPSHARLRLPGGRRMIMTYDNVCEWRCE